MDISWLFIYSFCVPLKLQIYYVIYHFYYRDANMQQTTSLKSLQQLPGSKHLGCNCISGGGD